MVIRLLSGVYYILSGSGIFSIKLGLPYAITLGIILGLSYLIYHLKKNLFDNFFIFILILTNLSIQLTGGLTSPLFTLNFICIIILFYHEPNWISFFFTGLSLVSFATAALIRSEIKVASCLILGLFIIITYLYFRRIRSDLTATYSTVAYYEARSQFLTGQRVDRTAEGMVKESGSYAQILRPINYFLRFIHNAFQAYTSCIFGYIPEEGEFLLIAGTSSSTKFKDQVHIRMGETFVGMIGKERHEVLIKDYYEDANWLGYYSGEIGIRSVIGAPIVFGEKLEGVIVVDRKEGSFTEEDCERLRLSAVTCAHLIGMLRSYEAKRYEASYFLALYELIKRLQKELTLEDILSIALDSTLEVLDCDTVAIAETDTINNRGRILTIKSNFKGLQIERVGDEFKLDEGLVGWVATFGGYLIKDDLRSVKSPRFSKREPRTLSRSFLGVPIKNEDQVIGVVWIESRLPKRFREEDAKFMNFLAAQISLAWIRANLYNQVKELSVRDGLTGLFNHRQFHEILNEEIKKNREICLLLIDVDHFKNINDRFGHPLGDEVLKTIGRLLSDEPGCAARYGGEEFALILPNYTIKKAREVALKFQDKLKKEKFGCGEEIFSVTTSIGISHFPSCANQKERLIEQADSALYQAKQEGRDRVVIYNKNKEK
ncbi:MAG: diguanylate cyclase [candidate division WOR-3 bacterium]